MNSIKGFILAVKESGSPRFEYKMKGSNNLTTEDLNQADIFSQEEFNNLEPDSLTQFNAVLEVRITPIGFSKRGD